MTGSLSVERRPFGATLTKSTGIGDRLKPNEVR